MRQECTYNRVYVQSLSRPLLNMNSYKSLSKFCKEIAVYDQIKCNAKWEIFVSECEAETSQGRCSEKCRQHLNATLATQNGAEFASCTCTDKEDNRCIRLKDVSLKACKVSLFLY